MIDEAIITLLQADSGVTTLVDSRIYFVAAEQGSTLPLLVVARISATERNLHHYGPAAFAKSRYQFSCIGNGVLEAKNVSAAVRTLFHGYKGSQSGTEIYWGKAVNEIDVVDEDLGFAVFLDVMFSHSD